MVIRYASIVSENSSNDDESISTSMTNLIQKGMNQDLFVTQNIVKLNYIEENVVDASTLPPLRGNNNETITVGANTKGGQFDERLSHQASSSANVGLAVSTATLVALFVVGSVFLVKRKFRKSNKDLNQDESLSQQEDDYVGVEAGNHRHEHHLDDSDMMEDNDNDDDDDDDDDQAIMNPAKAKYYDKDDDTFLRRSKKCLLSTISEVSEETDSSVNNSIKGSPSGSSVRSEEPFSRILSESIYDDDLYV